MDSILDLFEERVRQNKSLTPKMQDILKASLELFSEKGYSNTSTKDIAQSAKVAEGTIFKHFGSKENLLYATLIPLLKHTMAQEWEAQLVFLRPNIAAFPFTLFIREVIEKRLIHVRENVKVLKILYTEYLYQEDMREKLVELFPPEMIKEVNSVLDYYKADKQLVDIPNSELFRFIAGTFMSYLLSNEMFPVSEEEQAQQMENVIQFLTKGLAPND